METLSSSLCACVQGLIYHDKHWLITYEFQDTQGYQVTDCINPWLWCPVCSQKNFLSISAYKEREKQIIAK